MKRKVKLQRVDNDFEKWAREICKQRYIKGLDKREVKMPRFTKALTRVPRLREVMMEAEFLDEKKMMKDLKWTNKP